MPILSNPSGLSKARAQQILTQLSTRIAQGEFSSQSDLLAAIEAAWTTLNLTTEGPSLTIPVFRKGDIPLAENLTIPYGETENDLALLASEWESLRQTLLNDFNRRRADVLGLQATIGQVQQKTIQFQLSASDSLANFVWVSDTFHTLDNVDGDQTNAYVDTRAGAVSLGVDRLVDLDSTVASIAVDRKASQGIPGNNLEITASGPSQLPEAQPEPQPQLAGNPTPHTDITAILDNNPSTWFEWESNFIPKSQKLRKIRSAYVYDLSGGTAADVLEITGGADKGWGWRRFIAWPGSSDWDRGPDSKGYWLTDFESQKPATLVLTITLSSPQAISTISLTPQLFGNTYPILRKLSISRDGEFWVDVATDVALSTQLNEALVSGRIGVPQANYAGVGIWSLPTKVPIQYIRLALESKEAYTPPLGMGHHYYVTFTQETKTNSGFFGIGASTDTWVQQTREPNPEEGLLVAPPSQGVNATSLLTSVGAAAGSFIPGVGSLVGGLIGGLIGDVVDGIFSVKHTSKLLSTEDHYDVFNGTRAVIGIRDLNLSQRTYKATSQIVTRQLTFPRPVTSVALITTEEIPLDWDTNTRWITYAVSTDGHTWQSIVPEAYSVGPDSVVTLNTQNVFLRATLTRPADKSGETATLRSFALKGLFV